MFQVFPVCSQFHRQSFIVFIAVLEALLAVRSLRTGRGGGLDRFYLGNLDVPVATVFSERQFDPELLPHAIDDLIQGLRQGGDLAEGFGLCRAQPLGCPTG
jgi:hypothetical protein